MSLKITSRIGTWENYNNIITIRYPKEKEVFINLGQSVVNKKGIECK